MSLFRTKNLDTMVAASRVPGGLKKVLGPMDLILMGIGAIVGTGIFVLTGTGAVTAGPALTLAFVIAAVACGFAALCYAEFASTVPVAGSIYTYSYATLGEIVAWMIGWDLLLEYGLATSTVSVGWSGYFQSLIGGFGLEIPYYWVLAPDYDATFSPRVLTNQGLLLRAEFRQRLIDGAYSIRASGIYQLDKGAYMRSDGTPTPGYRDFRGSIETTAPRQVRGILAWPPSS